MPLVVGVSEMTFLLLALTDATRSMVVGSVMD